MAYVGYYAADGSMNVTVVVGTSYTGVQAADGSTNVIVSPGNIYVGSYHPCGALWVSLAPTSPTIPTPIHAPDGSLYVYITKGSNSNTLGGQSVTVVSGSLTPGGSYVPTYYIYGF